MLQVVVWFIIIMLLITGGIRGKVELSQVDVFGYAALVLGLIEWKRTGHFFSKPLRQYIQKLKRAVERRPTSVLLALIAGHIIIYTWTLVWRFQSLNANAFDLGYVDQAVWSQAYGVGDVFLHSTLSRGVGSYLSEHFSPILAVFAPFYRLWDSVYWLFFFQSALLGAGAALIYALARRNKLATSYALLIAVVYLLYQPLRAGNLFDFREDVFFVPLILGMILTLERERWTPLFILAALSFCVKENAPLVTFAIGAWAFARGKRGPGITLCLVSIGVLVLINTLVTPHFSSGSSNTVLAGRFSPLGATPGEMIHNVIFHPFRSFGKIFHDRFSIRTPRYLLTVLLPFAPFLVVRPLKRAFPFLIAAGLLAMNMLITEHKVGFHYELILIPFLFTGLIYGFRGANAGALLITLVFCVYGRSPILAAREYHPTPEQRCIGQALQHIPREASIATQSGLYTQLDHRRDAYLFSNMHATKQDFVILSWLPNVSIYPSFTFADEARKLSGSPYRKLFSHRLLEVWCAPDACERYAKLADTLSAETCLAE